MAFLRDLPARPRNAATAPSYPRRVLLGALALVAATGACKPSNIDGGMPEGWGGGTTVTNEGGSGGGSTTPNQGGAGGTSTDTITFSGGTGEPWGTGGGGAGGGITTTTDTGSTTGSGGEGGAGGGKF